MPETKNYWDLVARSGQVDPLQPGTTSFNQPVAQNTNQGGGGVFSKIPSAIGGFFTDLFRGSSGPGMNDVTGDGVTQLTPEQSQQVYDAGLTTNTDWQRMAYNSTFSNDATVAEAGGGGGGETGGTGDDETGGTGDDETGGPKMGETKVIDGVTYFWDGSRWVRVETSSGPVGAGGAGGAGAGTGETGGPKEGDVRRGENNQIEEFRNGVWQVAGGGRTTEIVRTDPNTPEQVPGADANMPVNKYMEALGTDTLSGQAYQEILAQRLANLEEQRFSAGQAYGDIYEQARMSAATRQGMSDRTGFAGGMADQQGAKLSAVEMGAMGQIGMGRESAMRGLEREEMAAPLQAFSDAQQIDQWSKAMEQYERQMGYEDTLRGREDVMFDQSQEDRARALGDMDTERERQGLQDLYNQQAINAQQRVDILQQRDYWRGVLQDPATEENRQLRDMAQQNLDRLDSEYSTLLADYGRLNNEALERSGGEPTPEQDTTGDTPPSLTDGAGMSTIDKVDTIAEMFNDTFELTDLEIRRSPFKDSIVSNANDLGRLVTELGRENAANDPNYDYQYEMNLMNRAITDRTALSRDEWDKLNKYTNSQTQASFTPDIVRLSALGQSKNPKMAIPATEATGAWIESLIASGELSSTDYKERNPSFFSNIVVGTGLKNYDKNYEIQLSGKTFTEYKKDYFDFLDTYNQKHKSPQG